MSDAVTNTPSKDHGGEEHHDHPNYVKVWGILVVLFMISVLGPLVGIRTITLITAFGVAVVKAWLVVRNFMHIYIEPKFIAYLGGSMLAFMVLLFFGVAPDVMEHQGLHWVNDAAKAEIARRQAEGGGHHGAAHGGSEGGAAEGSH